MKNVFFTIALLLTVFCCSCTEEENLNMNDLYKEIGHNVKLKTHNTDAESFQRYICGGAWEIDKTYFVKMLSFSAEKHNLEVHLQEDASMNRIGATLFYYSFLDNDNMKCFSYCHDSEKESGYFQCIYDYDASSCMLTMHHPLNGDQKFVVLSIEDSQLVTISSADNKDSNVLRTLNVYKRIDYNSIPKWCNKKL